MKTKKLLILLGMGLSLITTNSIANEDIKAIDIMKKVDARDDGDSIEEDMQMVLIDKNQKEKRRDIKLYSKDFGEDEYRIMFFKSPSNIKNTSYLIYDYDDSQKDNDRWLYLPALKKIKRIPSTDQSSSFMGSDFSYFDMSDRDLENYDFKLLKEIEVNGQSAWVIESTPRSQKVIDESNYERSILIVRKDNFVVIRAINFLTNGKVKYMEVKELHEENGI